MTADETRSGAVLTARPATRGGIVQRVVAASEWSQRTQPTPDEIPPSVASGSTTGRSVSASESPPSNPSDAPSKPSMRRFRKPKNVSEFAGQANRVATMILNGEIDLDTARAYSAVARTVAQSVSAQVAHARFLRTQPELDFPEEDDEG